MESNNRAGQRQRLIWSADVITREGPVPARLTNLSKTGAKLAVRSAIPDKSDVVLKTKHLFAAARVIWVREGEVGLEFYREQAVPEQRPAARGVA